MKFTNIVVKLLTIMCVVAITGLTLMVFIQVVSRMFNYSIPGTEELSRLLIVWLTFLGTSLAVHEKMNLSVNYFVKLVSEKIQNIIYIIVSLLIITFFCILVFYGFKLTLGAMSTSSSTLNLPMGLFYLAIPLSSLFSIFFMLINILETKKTNGGETSL